MKKRAVIRIISYSFAVIFALGGFWFTERKTALRYRMSVQNDYSRSLSELSSRLNNISVMLKKAVYISDSAGLSSLSAELYSEAELAKQALSGLPAGKTSLDTINRFLSQVGNYALSVSKSFINDREISDEQKKNLTKLGESALTISEAVADSQINFNNGDYWKTVLEEKIKNVSGGSLAQSLTELEENLTDYPTLIYDGPYSDHILKKQPLMTSNAPLITKDSALKLAKEISGDKAVNFEEEQSGKIPVYRFKSDYTDIAISKNGGYTVYMRKNRSIGAVKLSYSQAVSRAKKFALENGFEGMSETYYYTNDGVCTVNLAYLDGQTLCYTDLIKVGIALDSGDAVFFESAGYLANHTERAFETPVHSAEEAEMCINSALTVKKVALALIPTDGGAEVRCYEFTCKGQDGEEILSYINTKTLTNEQIFIVLKTDGGTLVK